jgi:hypothetical protein
MMVSAANGAKLISNSVAPSAMAMYFIVIFPYPIIAPVNGASRFIVIKATFNSCSVLRYARFVQSAFKMPQNRMLGTILRFPLGVSVKLPDKKSGVPTE